MRPRCLESSSASTSSRSAQLPCRVLCRSRGPRSHRSIAVFAAAQPATQTAKPSSQASTSGRPAPELTAPSRGRLPVPVTSWRLPEESTLPLYTCLDGDVLTPANRFAYYDALRSGLKALRALGINGVSVDVCWGLVEGGGPGVYDWSAYKQLLALIRDEGFMAQVVLCFHATPSVPLPAWVEEAGAANPDLFYADRAGSRCREYLSLGVDHVPVVAGRTAVECYRDLMASFRRELGPLLGSCVTDVAVGLGPDGELKYPAHPRDKRWAFPGVGEFQCYDRYMLASLRACAHQVSQPSWGLGGPHDAGAYGAAPHNTGFFAQHGSWASPYGKFFLQWYSDMLLQHADSVLGAAREALLGTPPPHPHAAPHRAPAPAAALPPPLRLHAKLPALYWWFATASHAPELTAGYYNTATRDGYLPVMAVLAAHGVGARLKGAELRTAELAPVHCCDPERQLAQQRTVAAALRLPVGVENAGERFDEAGLGRLEAALFEPGLYSGIELPPVNSLVFNRMCDALFEPGNWGRFKEFVRRVRGRADTLVLPWRGAAPEAAAGGPGREGPQPQPQAQAAALGSSQQQAQQGQEGAAEAQQGAGLGAMQLA
ncbi:hypothetical protein HYH03_005868 [Edaphochlamys debaryana]|uniref:Beta-amylase n=1 Tax=Edaphochlamys debaryana TaxID=47281 RepID=A0A835Y6E5_9CHLO|nr:hypothetical protein HYH03_005868 [Edaphochlamys debaryana]|eukprot:KAG2495937.1 hypothetical protein HYH03_005868 [Edaphochlamys debaryana]